MLTPSTSKNKRLGVASAARSALQAGGLRAPGCSEASARAWQAREQINTNECDYIALRRRRGIRPGAVRARSASAAAHAAELACTSRLGSGRQSLLTLRWSQESERDRYRCALCVVACASESCGKGARPLPCRFVAERPPGLPAAAAGCPHIRGTARGQRASK